MNSMFGKSFEPISQSERIKNKRNKTLYQSVSSSNDICLDKNGNIKNAKNYESFMNTVNGYYECKKEDISKNQTCFNTYLDDRIKQMNLVFQLLKMCKVILLIFKCMMKMIIIEVPSEEKI